VFTRKHERRTWFALAAALVLLAGAMMALPQPARAYTDTFYSYDNLPPDLYLARGGSINGDNAIMGTLTAYMTYDGYRHRITMAAGSGDGSWDSVSDCQKYQPSPFNPGGPAPDGYYGRSDGDSNSDLYLYYKDSGSTVVRGWVWFMDSKRCDGGTSTLRTELFIHSEGYSGWDDSNYKSEGCIKINQTDRSWLEAVQRVSYQYTNDRLYVYGNEV